MSDLIDRFLDHLHDLGRAQRTIDLRRQILTRIDRNLPCGLDVANAEELKDWIYRDEWAPNTKASYWSSANSFFEWATRPIDPQLSFNPMELLPVPATEQGLPRPITDKQLTFILDNAVEPYRTWCCLAAYEGMRCCEISRGDQRDISEAETTIYKGKRGKPRVVPTHPLVWACIRVMPPGPLARRPDGARMAPRYVSQRTAEYLAALLKCGGLIDDDEAVGLHRMRHWFATTLRRAGKDLSLIRDLLGHARLSTTEIYALIPDEERRAAIHALPTLTIASS